MITWVLNAFKTLKGDSDYMGGFMTFGSICTSGVDWSVRGTDFCFLLLPLLREMELFLLLLRETEILRCCRRRPGFLAASRNGRQRAEGVNCQLRPGPANCTDTQRYC